MFKLYRRGGEEKLTVGREGESEPSILEGSCMSGEAGGARGRPKLGPPTERNSAREGVPVLGASLGGVGARSRILM